MSRFFAQSLGVWLCICLFAACGGGEPTDEGNPSSTCNIVEIDDSITENTTWDGDHVYVIRAWDMWASATLVIEPGAVIKLTADGPDLSLGGDGVIVAKGTVERPIIFTSVRDDSDGCDSNGDGDATHPARRDWGGINLNGTQGSVFEHCFFFYGGDTAYSGTLVVSSGATAEIRDSVFAHNDGGDASGWYGALDATGGETGTVIENTVFYDNVRPLGVSTLFDVDDSNTFHDPANPSQANEYNGIFVESLAGIGRHLTWEETEVPFVIDDNDLWIDTGATLTLGDDVVVKLRPGSELVLDDGASSLVNHDGTGVFFTSYRDDAHKGDTNADGSATAPADGDWIGIYDNTAPTEPFYFAWPNILYDAVH